MKPRPYPQYLYHLSSWASKQHISTIRSSCSLLDMAWARGHHRLSKANPKLDQVGR